MLLLAGKFLFISTIVCCIYKLSYRRKGESVLFVFCPLLDTFLGGLPKGTKDWGKEGDIKFVDAVMFVMSELHCCEAKNFVCKIICCI